MVTIQPVISTPDLARLRAFYQDLLGAVETHRYPEDGPAFYVGLKLGDSELGLVSEATDLAPSSRILLNVAVADIDGMLDRVAPAGGDVLGPATDMPWGQRVVHLHDPDGNLVNLTQEL